jgi:hypothetical protein
MAFNFKFTTHTPILNFIMWRVGYCLVEGVMKYFWYAHYIRTRNLPVLGRWFKFQPEVWLSLSHFGIEGHPIHLWASNVESMPFRRRRPLRPLLGRSGCAYLIPASKSWPRPLRGPSNQNTFNPVGLRLPHSGVKGHQDHFWVGRAVPISFRRRKVTKTASGLVGPHLSYSGNEG